MDIAAWGILVEIGFGDGATAGGSVSALLSANRNHSARRRHLETWSVHLVRRDSDGPDAVDLLSGYIQIRFCYDDHGVPHSHVVSPDSISSLPSLTVPSFPAAAI
jgi:hypothetical protein